MIPNRQSYFPQQRVDGATKQKADWYANCIDYIIDACDTVNTKKLLIDLGDNPKRLSLEPRRYNNETW